MVAHSFYKIAFWALLFTIAVFQLIIAIIAHDHHDAATEDLLVQNAKHQVFAVRSLHQPSGSQHARQQPSHVKSRLGAGVAETKKVWQEVLSSSPKIVLLHNFATEEECEHLIQLGIDKGMQRAQIIPYGGNQLIDSSTRTNTAAWLNYHQDAVVTRIENSIATHTKTHPLDGEALQILHYGSGQTFKPHRDAFDPVEDPPENFEPGGNRIITGLLYLQNAEEGGETHFTKLDLRIKPDVGDLLLFWNTNGDGSICLESEHAGTPPTKGQKWVATKWIHERVYQLKEAEIRGLSPQQVALERQQDIFS